MIGQTRPRVRRKTSRTAKWTITSPRMKTPARMTRNASAQRMKMTSLRMKLARKRPITAEQRLYGLSTKQLQDETDVTEDEKGTQSATSREMSSPLNETPRGTENQNDVTNDLENAEIASKGGVDITVPGISKNERNEENPSPRGGKYNLRPNPNPNFADEYR